MCARRRRFGKVRVYVQRRVPILVVVVHLRCICVDRAVGQRVRAAATRSHDFLSCLCGCLGRRGSGGRRVLLLRTIHGDSVALAVVFVSISPGVDQCDLSPCLDIRARVGGCVGRAYERRRGRKAGGQCVPLRRTRMTAHGRTRPSSLLRRRAPRRRVDRTRRRRRRLSRRRACAVHRIGVFDRDRLVRLMSKETV